jgi:uncharacterized protein
MSSDARTMLDRYQQAMMRFSADELADLYAEDAVHEFPFFTPGHEPAYRGREEVRVAYRKAWSAPGVVLEEIINTGAHETADAETIVSEWSARARTHAGDPITLAGVLVITARDGRIVRVRDYMDVLGLAVKTGRARALLGALA